MSRRATVYLDEDLHRALKIKSVTMERSFEAIRIDCLSAGETIDEILEEREAPVR